MYKVVSRDRKTNTQVKKRIYETNKSFNLYGFDIIQRYSNWYQVEVYEMNFETEKWELVKIYPTKESVNEAFQVWKTSKELNFINMIKEI